MHFNDSFLSVTPSSILMYPESSAWPSSSSSYHSLSIFLLLESNEEMTRERDKEEGVFVIIFQWWSLFPLFCQLTPHFCSIRIFLFVSNVSLFVHLLCFVCGLDNHDCHSHTHHMFRDSLDKPWNGESRRMEMEDKWREWVTAFCMAGFL